MKDSLWSVIVVTMAFIGFLLGYSIPPLVEAGMIGSQNQAAGDKTELQQDMKDYYKDLLDEK